METKNTTFESLKKIEEIKKKRLLTKILSEVKKLSKSIAESKKLCDFYLEFVVDDIKERKQIIDWINNLADVLPDEDRVNELKDHSKKILKEETVKAEKEIADNPLKWMDSYQTILQKSNGLASATADFTYRSTYNTAGTNLALCSTANGIEVK